ncbi:uncharacterized protein LOC119107472 [Pollicipes pollicipes]|uniref:uncharacterized protein LOC119107472 n=1 Tax=Pollicipes pollicipes TaxID=41117 RepID=UPI0018853303|nr:uncharacterized protein LOC119107472 [Pollicipes pollicipes]
MDCNATSLPVAYSFVEERRWTPSAAASLLCLLMSSASCAGGLVGNFLLTFAILRTPPLRRTNTNQLVLQLCLTGVGVAATNVPLLLAILVVTSTGQALPAIVCDLQTVTFTAGVTCQLGLLSAISYERFHCVAYPFKTTNNQGQRLRIELGLVWSAAVTCGLADVRLSPETAVTALCAGRQLGAHFANTFCLLHFPIGAINIVIIGTFYLRIYLEIKEHVKKMNDKTLAQRTQQAVEQPFTPPSTAGGRRLSFLFPSSAPVSRSSSILFANGLETNRTPASRPRWLSLKRLQIFPSRQRRKSVAQTRLSVVSELHTLPSAGTPLNQPEAPMPGRLTSPDLSVLGEAADAELKQPITGSPPLIAPRLASADSDSGVDEPSGGDRGRPLGSSVVSNVTCNSATYTSADSAPGGRPLSFDGIPLIDDSDGEAAEAEDSVGQAAPVRRVSSHLRRSCRRPPLLELTSVDDSVAPVPAVDIDGNVSLARSTRQHRLVGAVCVMNSKARLRGRKKMEGKMAARAVLIIVVFLLFWLPLVVGAVVSEALLTCDFQRWASPLAELQLLALCFCNLSVVANPALYGLMVQQYRTALRQLGAAACGLRAICTAYHSEFSH